MAFFQKNRFPWDSASFVLGRIWVCPGSYICLALCAHVVSHSFLFMSNHSFSFIFISLMRILLPWTSVSFNGFHLHFPHAYIASMVRCVDTDAKHWCQALMPSTDAKHWCRNLVQKTGTENWCRKLARKLARKLSRKLVQKRGQNTGEENWCRNLARKLVQKTGAEHWCSTLVQHTGAENWCRNLARKLVQKTAAAENWCSTKLVQQKTGVAEIGAAENWWNTGSENWCRNLVQKTGAGSWPEKWWCKDLV